MLFPFFVLFKLKGGGIIILQNQSGIEFLACLAGQSFKDRRTSGAYQVTDVIFREMYAADFTKHVETTGFMSATWLPWHRCRHSAVRTLGSGRQDRTSALKKARGVPRK